MHPRVYGTEFEYGAYSWDLIPRFSIYTFLGAVKGSVEAMQAQDNGCKIYVDTGSHPEYCTPECLTPLEVVKHEKAGDCIMQDRFRNGIDISGHNGRVTFYRTPVDKHGHTHGYHENYLMDREAQFIKQLIPFLVTRVLYSGAGYVNNGFKISGRAGHIVTESSNNTTADRPIVQLRDEPLADRKYRRLHLIVGEPHMSEYATFLTIGATSLVLDLIEDGVCPEIVVDKPVETLHELAGMTSGWPIKLANGRSMSAVDLQEIYFEKAVRHYEQGCRRESYALRRMNKSILDVWIETLNVLKKDPYKLADRIDWAIELKMLQAYMARHNISWDDPRVAMLDLRYHEVGEGSAFHALQSRGMVRRLVTDEDIETAKTTPPNTRAKGRSIFVKGMRERGMPLKANHQNLWDSLSCYYLQEPKLSMPDPFNTYEEEARRFLQSLKSSGVQTAVYQSGSGREEDYE